MKNITSTLILLITCLFSPIIHAIDLNIDLGGVGHEIAQDESRNMLYVTIPSNNEVVGVSLDTMEVTHRLLVGSKPYGIDISHDYSKLYVALNGAGAIAVVDIESQTVSEIVIGEELGSSLTWDVIETEPNRLFATANPSSGGFSWVVQVRLDEGNSISRVASNRIIRAGPILEKSTNGDFLYVGEGFSPNSLYKLDLSDPLAPIVLEDNHGNVSGTSQLQVSPDGTRIHTASGQVLRSESFFQAGIVDAGITRYGITDGYFYVVSRATDNLVIEAYNSTTFVSEATYPLNCPASAGFKDFFILPEDRGALVLNANGLCGGEKDDVGEDIDSDGVIDREDNCPMDANPNQIDIDGDGKGNICDPYPESPDDFSACLADTDEKSITINQLEDRIQALEEEVESLKK